MKLKKEAFNLRFQRANGQAREGRIAPGWSAGPSRASKRF
ncbi:MAG: hypothetical protein WDM81_03335 [Rhizomicrobium sp.]